MKTLLPRWSWAYTPDVPRYLYSPRRAAAELDDGGYRLGSDGFRYRDGRRLSVVILGISGSNTGAKFDAILQASLKAVGIDATIKTQPYDLIFDLNGAIRQGNYNVTSYSYAVNYDPASLDDDGCDQFAPKGGNVDRYCDPVVDRLERQALITSSKLLRKRLYAEIERRRMAALASFPIGFMDRVGVLNSDLHGYTPSRGIIPEWNAWQWSLP